MKKGSSAIWHFANASEFESYLTEIHLQNNSVFYQAQFVNTAISKEVSVHIIKTCMKFAKTLNNRERHQRQKTCVSQVRPMNTNFAEKISTFKKKILDGSCFICIDYNRWLYERSAIDHKEEKYNIFVEGL